MTIGLRDLFFAKLTEVDGVDIYGIPKKLAEVMNADLSITVAEGKLYADDAISEDVKEFVSGLIKLGIKDLSPENTAELLGQEVDGDKVVWAGGDDEPPYVAIGFRAKKTGGRYRYIWLMKCKFKVPNEKFQTKGESITFNTPEIEGNFYLNKAGKWKADIVAKETDAVAAHWFDKVRVYGEDGDPGTGTDTGDQGGAGTGGEDSGSGENTGGTSGSESTGTGDGETEGNGGGIPTV